VTSGRYAVITLTTRDDRLSRHFIGAMKAKPSSHNCHQACGASTGQGCAQRTAEGGRRALTRAERRGTALQAARSDRSTATTDSDRS
jgi:hypothetical protein